MSCVLVSWQRRRGEEEEARLSRVGAGLFSKREWSSLDYLPILSITTVLQHFPNLISVDRWTPRQFVDRETGRLTTPRQFELPSGPSASKKPKVFIKYFPNVLTGSIVQIDVAVSFNKGLTVNGIQDKVLDIFRFQQN